MRSDDGVDLSTGRKVERPVLVLWGGFVGRHYAVLAAWRDYAARIEGGSCPATPTCPRTKAPAETGERLTHFWGGTRLRVGRLSPATGGGEP